MTSVSMTRSQLPLFVFGTLRRGHVNHHYLDGHYIRVITAILPGYTRIAPLMIAPSANQVVDGELFFLKPDEYDATMAGCDELEELSPGQLVGPEYQRKLVTVTTDEGSFEAWAYVQAESS